MEQNKNCWDVPSGKEIEVFDPSLSYEITGYRLMDQILIQIGLLKQEIILKRLVNIAMLYLMVKDGDSFGMKNIEDVNME